MTSIEKVEQLKDRVRVDYFLRKPYGVPDVRNFLEVMYKDIDRLPKIKDARQEFDWKEEVNIEKLEKKIIFLFKYTQEKSWGPLEEDIFGPFVE